MRKNDRLYAAAKALAALITAPLHADIVPPERPVRLPGDVAISPALLLGLIMLVIAGLGIFFYRRQRT